MNKTIKKEAVINDRSCQTCDISSVETICTNIGEAKQLLEISKGTGLLANIAVTCGIIGLIVAGIPMGIIAIVCGIIAAAKGAKKRGGFGIMLGTIGIISASTTIYQILHK